MSEDARYNQFFVEHSQDQYMPRRLLQGVVWVISTVSLGLTNQDES